MHVRVRWFAIVFVVGLVATGRSASPDEPSLFLQQVRTSFAAWDTDADGQLSRNEIELGLANPAVKGDAAAAMASLRRAIRANRSRKSFTLAEIEASVPYRADADPQMPKFEAMFVTAQAKIQSAGRELFMSGKPQIKNLHQGRLGDCFLLAAIGSCVHRDPERIVRMMEPLENGQCAVTFGNGRRLVMPLPTDGEIAIGASTRSDGLWANMLEKAIGQIYLERSTSGRHVAPFSIIGVGGSPATVLKLLTGHKTRRYGCELFQRGNLDPAEREALLDEMREALVDAQRDGRMFCGGTAPKGKQTLVPGLYYNHSYGVLGYNELTDEVTFWNPFGNKYTPRGPAGLTHGFATSFGQFTMKLPEAVMWFGSFSIETDEPADVATVN